MLRVLSYVLTAARQANYPSYAYDESSSNNKFQTTGVPDAKINPQGSGENSMNIFDTLTVYAEKWQVKNSRSFDANEIEAVESATVVNSDYGFSVCFMMKRGGRTYIPLSNDSELGVGASVDMSTAKLLTLSKSGEKDILRVQA